MSRVLGRLAGAFDVVLIDTGPVLGSVEAASAVVNSGRVLLVVSRGQNESLVRVARERIEQLGATQLGVIFNRASRSDVERDPTSVSVSRSSQRSGSSAKHRLGLAEAAGTGDRVDATGDAA